MKSTPSLKKVDAVVGCKARWSFDGSMAFVETLPSTFGEEDGLWANRVDAL